MSTKTTIHNVNHDSDAMNCNKSDIFRRVRDAYDLPLMEGSRLIAVGAGGAAAFLEDMARAGIGSFVLIDPDQVSAANIGTQQTYVSDIGRYKVDCIKER